MEDLQKMREELAKLAKIAKIAKIAMIAKTVNQWKVEVHPSKHLVKDEKENKRKNSGIFSTYNTGSPL